MPEKNSEIAAPVLERLVYNRIELGQVLGLCETSIWRLERRGLIKPVPGLRHKLYSVEAVKRFIAGKAVA